MAAGRLLCGTEDSRRTRSLDGDTEALGDNLVSSQLLWYWPG